MKCSRSIQTQVIFLLPILSLSALLPMDVSAQSGTSAREAFRTVSAQFGPQSVQWIAEMRGVGGVPQPLEWHILAYEPGSNWLLRRYWSAEGRAGDNGPDVSRYPEDVPVGFFSMNKLGVDSVAAFTIAEAEARRARMGFDSCNYLLRVREYSSEPIWRLELIDVNDQLVGKVYVSGQNGEVLRTVWVDRSQGGRIIDSSAPGNRVAPPADPGLSGSGDLSPGPITGSSAKPFTPVPPTGFTTTPPRMTPTSPRVSPPSTGTVESPAETTTRPSVPATQPPVSEARPDSAIRDLREMPEKPKDPKTEKDDSPKPPVPTSSSGGSSGRIPPPPIPPG